MSFRDDATFWRHSCSDQMFLIASHCRRSSSAGSKRLMCQHLLLAPRTFATASVTPVAPPVRLLTDTLHSLLDETDIFIFDCDGVLWKGNQRINCAHDVIRQLKQMGKKLYFVTNNSTKCRLTLKKKFDKLDLDVEPDEILSSSYAAALYLKQLGFGEQDEPGGRFKNKKVYVVGEAGICDELQRVGIVCIGGLAHSGEQVDLSLNEGLRVDPEIGAVVAGLDTQINYYKIQYAQLCINELKCEFIATNTDEMAHLTSTQQWAGGGAVIGALRGCTGREPVLVGKPSSFLIEHIFAKHTDVEPSRICMVGDRLNTDILFGLNHNLTTLLTLTGVTKEKHLFSSDNQIIPHYFMDSIDDMLF